MISCELHDYIEIVCLFYYPIRLTMKDSSVINGIAIDTQLDENKHECIKVKQDNGETLLVLDNLSKLDVCIDNPHFKTIRF